MTRRHARGGITEGDWNFVSRETIAEKADVRKEDEVVIETVETRPCYYTDQEVVAVDNQEKSSAQEPGECIWRQSDVDISDTSTGIQNVLENEDEISGEIHGKIFSKSDGSVNEIRKVFLEFYKMDIKSSEYLYSEHCNSKCRFGESCSTVTSLKVSVKPGLNKLSRQ